MAAIVRFRRSALDDIARYETWREEQDRHRAPIADALLDAIVQAAGRFDSFDQIPTPRLALNGEVADIKRLLVPVRSKVCRVYVGRGRRTDEISVRRIQHPSQEPVEC